MENVTAAVLILIIDEFEDLKDNIHRNMDLHWDQMCKTTKAENIKRLIYVITRAVKSKK